MRFVLATLLGKTLRGLIRLVRRGGGSALPGLLVEKVAPGFLSHAIKTLPDGFVVVSGSAGKSSTTYLLSSLLRAHGKTVFSNDSTANIQQGLMSAVLKSCDLRGNLPYDIAVLEVDEGHLRPLIEINPRLAVLTNVLSDQLDRFIDPEIVIDRLQEVASAVDLVVINSDDPNLNQLRFKTSPVAVGLSNELLLSPVAPKYALNFGEKVEHLKTLVVQGDADFEVLDGLEAYQTAASNPQHALNDALALAASKQLLKVDPSIVRKVLAEEKRVFARNETVQVLGRTVNLRLVQNPTSFQLNLDELGGGENPIMLMAGSDIHDPSWLWTVDFSKLSKVDIVSGTNAFDLALRLFFNGVEVSYLEVDASKAADRFLSLPGDSHTILFSADAMRKTRRHLGLAK